MGHTLSQIMKDLDGQDEKKKEAQDALNAMVTIAKDKQTIHYQSVFSNAVDAKLLPIHYVVTKMQQINCGVSKDADGLKKNITDAVNNFVKGDIVDGLAAIASQALDTLMGKVSANSSEYSGYTITVGKLGGVGRIDFYMYYYKYTSSSLTKVTEDCLVTSLVISSVDVKGLNNNDVRVIVQNNYSGKLEGESEDQTAARLGKIVKLITEAVSASNGVMSNSGESM